MRVSESFGFLLQVEMESFDEMFSYLNFPEVDEVTGVAEKETRVDEERKEDIKGDAFVAVEHREDLHLSEISLPEETEAASLEWLSRFVDECHSEHPQPPLGVAGIRKAPPSMSPSCRLNTEALVPVKGKRSKRSKLSGSIWSFTGRLCLGDTSSISAILFSPFFLDDKPATRKPKKRGRKPKNPLLTGTASSERKCTHCGVEKTPQWRAGPRGPKTLCNACGVRFKSGRLLPEYRPACCPTFVSNVHSNSHRKVLEIRRKKEGQLFSASAPPVASC